MNRRSFMAGGPAGALGLGALAGLLDAQSGAVTREISNDVVDFWVNRVGIPSDMILAKGAKGRGGRAIGEASLRTQERQPAGAYGSEPMLVYIDNVEAKAVPAQEVRASDLLQHGDAVVELQVGRLRLNEGDQSQFTTLASGGLYLDVEQKPSPMPEGPLSLGWSLLGAMLPGKYRDMAAKAGGGEQPPAGDSGQLQSIVLPGGAGKTMFSCFLKGEKKSPFGSFLSVFNQIGTVTNSFLPMLQLPGLSSPALMAVRALAGKLQGLGGNHRWLFQTSPVDVACTAEAVAGAGGDCIRLRSGYYIVLAKSQAGLLRDEANNLRVLDGFLVPKEAKLLDVYEAAPATAAGVSYLSLRLNVKRIQLRGCQATAGS